MNTIVKYGFAGAIFFTLLAVTVLVLPIIIDVQKFEPEIEKKLSDITGRSITIGSDLGVSFIPTLNISFSNLKMGNPEGYLSDYFLKIESFEARIKPLSLFKKEIEFSRFIISGLEVNLERRTDGRGNWDLSKKHSAENLTAASSLSLSGWSVPSKFSIGLFAVTDGTAIWIDRAQNSHHRIDDLMLLLYNFSLTHPVAGEMKASIKGKSLAAEGKVGPLDKKDAQGRVPFDLLVNFFDTFTGHMEGEFADQAENQLYDLEIKLEPSSAKDLFASLDIASSRKIQSEFSELKNIFSIRNDLVDSRDTMLTTPFATILISGTADHIRHQTELLTVPNLLENVAKEQQQLDAQPENIKKSPVNKPVKAGSGKIFTSPLQERHEWQKFISE
jgi:AsmA protein